MRHDPASGAIVIMLRSLKMYGMAQAVTDLIEQGAPAFDAAVPILSQLLKAELAEREVRSIAYHLKAARFPAYKDLSGFDFASSEINEATVRQLHRCEFLDGAQNAVLIGGPGTGKTHVATALGIQAIEHPGERSASSRPSSSSMRSSRRRRRAKPVRSPKASPASIS
jgi:DNA replication protein DnaC